MSPWACSCTPPHAAGLDKHFLIVPIVTTHASSRVPFVCPHLHPCIPTTPAQATQYVKLPTTASMADPDVYSCLLSSICNPGTLLGPYDANDPEYCYSLCTGASYVVFDAGIPAGDNCFCYSACTPKYVEGSPDSAINIYGLTSKDCPLVPYGTCLTAPEYGCAGPTPSDSTTGSSLTLDDCVKFCQSQNLDFIHVTYLPVDPLIDGPDTCQCFTEASCGGPALMPSGGESAVVQYKDPDADPCLCQGIDPADYVGDRFKTHPAKYVKPGRRVRLGLSLVEAASLPDGVGLRLELPADDVTVVKATLAGGAKGLSKAAKRGEVVVDDNGVVSITWSDVNDLFRPGGWGKAKPPLKFNVVAKVKAGATKGDALVMDAYLTGGEICDVKIGSSTAVTVK